MMISLIAKWIGYLFIFVGAFAVIGYPSLKLVEYEKPKDGMDGLLWLADRTVSKFISFETALEFSLKGKKNTPKSNLDVLRNDRILS